MKFLSILALAVTIAFCATGPSSFAQSKEGIKKERGKKLSAREKKRRARAYWRKQPRGTHPMCAPGHYKKHKGKARYMKFYRSYC